MRVRFIQRLCSCSWVLGGDSIGGLRGKAFQTSEEPRSLCSPFRYPLKSRDPSLIWGPWPGHLERMLGWSSCFSPTHTIACLLVFKTSSPKALPPSLPTLALQRGACWTPVYFSHKHTWVLMNEEGCIPSMLLTCGGLKKPYFGVGAALLSGIPYAPGCSPCAPSRTLTAGTCPYLFSSPWPKDLTCPRGLWVLGC